MSEDNGQNNMMEEIDQLIDEGDEEILELLYDADVLYQCRFCRNIFRSVINYISHKRAFCRASAVAVVDEDGKTDPATKKRFGQMSTLTKRLETTMVLIGDTQETTALHALPRIMKELPTTTFVDGCQKVVGALPSGLAQKETLAEDRVCLTMPQDYSSKYKEMSLRRRKTENSGKRQHRVFTSNEIRIIENFEKQGVRCADFVLLQCEHPPCAHVRPFHSLEALAYHCSLRHTKAFTEGGYERWPCLLCPRHMPSLEDVHRHLHYVHRFVKEDHLREREKEDKVLAKGGRKSMRDSLSNPRRSRSLSMDSKTDGDEEEEDEKDEEEEGRGKKKKRSLSRKSEEVGLRESTPSDSLRLSSSGHGTAASVADADAARPARQPKRPLRMLDGEEEYDEGGGKKKVEGGEARQDNPIVDESDEEDTPKEFKKKKEAPTELIMPCKKKIQRNEHGSSMVEEKCADTSEVMMFTPKAGKHVMEKIRAAAETSLNSNERKQNLGKLADDSEEIVIVGDGDEMSSPNLSDLTSVPVYISEHQQQIFFSGLSQSEDAGGNDVVECIYCNTKLPNMRDGRRHMVAHVRAMRLRCGLCGAGSFFSIDMRNHLQLRGCPKLDDAPPSYVRPGQPCMTDEHADELTLVAHSGSPGRALFTTGKIVSIMSTVPYLPDPVIEEKILGPTRVPPRILKEDAQSAADADTAPSILPIEDAAATLPAASRSSSPEEATSAQY